MKIYLVEEAPGYEAAYFPTKKEAKKHAAEVSASVGRVTTVTEIKLRKLTPKVMCNILGGWGGYAAYERSIYTVYAVPDEAFNTEEVDHD